MVGRDTRESGDWIERELARGAARRGGDDDERRRGADAGGRLRDARRWGSTPGIVISASHNPFEDNGIKVFSGRGEKFTEALEREVEAIVADRRLGRAAIGATRRSTQPTSSTPISTHLRGSRCRTRSALGAVQAGDRYCANGATTTVAPRLFRELGFDVDRHRRRRPTAATSTCSAARPIPRRWRAPSREHGCRMGVAFDGDGDRAIFVDANGAIVDGDAVLLMCGRQLQAAGAGCRATPSSRP